MIAALKVLRPTYNLHVVHCICDQSHLIRGKARHIVHLRRVTAKVSSIPINPSDQP